MYPPGRTNNSRHEGDIIRRIVIIVKEISFGGLLLYSQNDIF
jgi:hypothetical protein